MTRRFRPTHKRYTIPLFCAAIFSSFLNCKTEERLEQLGKKVAGPIDVAQANGLFYVLNSDFDRSHTSGSILIVDPSAKDGEQKLKAITTARMGRSLHINDSLMLVTFDQEELGGQGQVQLRQVSEDGLELPVVASWPIDCSPVNAIISPLKRYLAVSCLGGDTWVGRLDANDPSQSTLQLVRSYGMTRRAIYIHESESQAVLIAFPTDMGEQRFTDLTDSDVKSYDPEAEPNNDGTLVLKDESNEVPDIFEQTVSDLRRLNARRTYQMVIYNLKSGEANGFPFVELGTLKKPTLADQEHKYIYYNLKGRNTEQELDQTAENGQKFYHTNFWEAKQDPLAANSFLISQRGISSSVYANNVIRVTLNQPALLNDAENFGLTSEMFSFERIFGFSADNPSSKNYPGDFELYQADSKNLLVVNNFRDAVYWPGQENFAVTVKSLGEANTSTKPAEYLSDDFDESAYQLAIDDSGTVLSCSFYGGALLVFDLADDGSISLRKKIEN